MFMNQFLMLFNEAPPAGGGGGGGTAEPPATPPAPGATPPAGNEPPPSKPPETPPAPGNEPPKFTGELPDGWVTQLGDEFAPYANDLSKHKNLQTLIQELDYYRKAGVEYPGEGADEKAVERFRKAAGVPESPEGYGLTAEALQLPEGAEFDQELADKVAEAALGAHAPPGAVKAITAVFNEVVGSRMAAAKAESDAKKQAAATVLHQDWGDSYEGNASIVRHLTETFAGHAGVELEDAAQLANNPAFAKIMFEVSKLTSEDPTRAPAGFGDIRTAQQKIDDITSGKDPVWGEKYHSKNKADQLAAYEQVKKLRELAKR